MHFKSSYLVTSRQKSVGRSRSRQPRCHAAIGPNIDVFEANTRLTVGYRVRPCGRMPEAARTRPAHVCRRIARRRSFRVIVPWSNTRRTTRFTASSAADPEARNSKRPFAIATLTPAQAAPRRAPGGPGQAPPGGEPCSEAEPLRQPGLWRSANASSAQTPAGDRRGRTPSLKAGQRSGRSGCCDARGDPPRSCAGLRTGAQEVGKCFANR